MKQSKSNNKKRKHKKEKKLVIRGDFNDVLKAAVAGNPKPNKKK
jgi:hypothetical protein